MTENQGQSRSFEMSARPVDSEATREVFFELLGENVDLLFRGINTENPKPTDDVTLSAFDEEFCIQLANSRSPEDDSDSGTNI